MGKLLKIDDYIGSLERAIFAGFCIKVNLCQPLKSGFWVGDENYRVLVVVLYQRLHFFCFKFGMVRHDTNSCSHWHGASIGELPSTS